MSMILWQGIEFVLRLTAAEKNLILERFDHRRAKLWKAADPRLPIDETTRDAIAAYIEDEGLELSKYWVIERPCILCEKHFGRLTEACRTCPLALYDRDKLQGEGCLLWVRALIPQITWPTDLYIKGGYLMWPAVAETDAQVRHFLDEAHKALDKYIKIRE